MNSTEQHLQAQWEGLLVSSQCRDPALKDAWWVRLRDHYSESTRHYHTLQHIDSMFSLFEGYMGKLTAPETVGWAIFFHDIIYDPKAKDNEEKSAELFQTFVGDCLQDSNSSTMQRVTELILLTKTHSTEAHRVPDMYGKGDEHFFLDFDMQVLGWPDVDYDRYAQQIRQEYIHIPEDQYRTARAQVLRKFLQTPNIYATKAFRDSYEGRARTNIAREIRKLEGNN